jgi:hypothetical protein
MASDYFFEQLPALGYSAFTESFITLNVTTISHAKDEARVFTKILFTEISQLIHSDSKVRKPLILLTISRERPRTGQPVKAL